MRSVIVPMASCPSRRSFGLIGAWRRGDPWTNRAADAPHFAFEFLGFCSPSLGEQEMAAVGRLPMRSAARATRSSRTRSALASACLKVFIEREAHHLGRVGTRRT
jgi:hypothetical protein